MDSRTAMSAVARRVKRERHGIKPKRLSWDAGIIIGMSDANRRATSHLVAAILVEAASGPFTDPLERMVWESGEFTPEERAEEIANLRIVRRFAVEPPSGLPAELSKDTMRG